MAILRVMSGKTKPDPSVFVYSRPLPTTGGSMRGHANKRGYAMRSSSLAFFLSFCVVCILTVVPAFAEDAPTLGPVERFLDQAELVVVARATNVQAEWNAAGTSIYTNVVYDVERVVKGTAALETVELHELGGTVGKITQAVVGGPQFSVGQRDLLFLVPSDAGGYRTYGLSAGQLPVHHDPASGRDVVRVDMSGALHGVPTGEPEAGPASRRVLALDGVIRALERAMTRGES